MICTVKWELVGVFVTESDGVVDDGAVDDGGEDAGGQLGHHLREEVRAHRVHVVVHLTQKHGSLVWEYQYYAYTVLVLVDYK